MKTREEKLAYLVEYRKNHKKQRKEYLEKNKEKIKIQKYKNWRKHYVYKPRIIKTKEEKLETRRKRYHNKIKHNTEFRLKKNFCKNIYRALKFGKSSSVCGWEKLLGYSLVQLRKHIENQFRPGMSWDNYGPVWHVDHIIPRSLFDFRDERQKIECWKLSNIQPLLAKENISKGNKILNSNKLVLS